MIRENELADTLIDEREPKSSSAILEAITDAEKAFDGYMAYCRAVDKAYSLSLSNSDIASHDETFALFWASMEILKPAIYAKPPKPIASPRFNDGGKVVKVTAELMERCLESSFDRGGIDEVMIGLRDDLALTNRGAAWVTYETDEKGGGQRLCYEDLDRTDFLHEPARKWSEVGWVARRAWLTKTQLKKRFKGLTEEQIERAQYITRKDQAEHGFTDSSAKAGVWEVWHRSDDRVYWVTPGVPVMLDDDEPHLNLSGFFPCPRPAYGTRQRRSLVPVPDYKRYSYHLEQINDLTVRIHTLLNQIRLKVFIPAGGDIGKAVETALNSVDESIVIPVPASALTQSAGQNLFLMLPLREIAEAITGLISARGQLVEDFYQLSGISDIMRGATQAEETLGAQQLKSQYGSVRVRDKIDELQRIARDVASIAAEIMATNFSKETLLELSQMDIPTKAEIAKKVKETEDAAKEEMEALAEQAKEAAEKVQQSGEKVDPAQAEQQFQQAQQAILAKYEPILQELGSAVPLEDVMEALRDKHGRNLGIDIETDSTILTDEMAEKASRAEFLNAFSSATVSVTSLLAAGEKGAKLAGGILKFALQPYRASRELDSLIDEFVDSPMPQQGGEPEGQAELIAAQNKLAEAEIMKAQAQTQKVSADAQGKMQELQLRGAEAQSKAQQDQQRLMLELQASQSQQKETEARIQKIFAEIEAMGIRTKVDVAKVGMEQHREQREDVKTAADIQGRQQDRAMGMQQHAEETAFRAKGEERADRQQSFSEQQGDRQLTLAERQALQAKELAQ